MLACGGEEMRILMLAERMECGGAETHILTLARELVSRGHTVSVASEGGALISALEKCGVRHLRLPLASHKLWNILFCRLRLRALIKKGRFDIIHSHSRLASLIVCGIAKKYRVPFVTTVHARFRLTRLTRALSRWGDAPIAVSEDLRQYLYESYRVQPSLVSVIPNGVDRARFCPSGERRQGKTILFLSRLDGDSSIGARLLCAVAPRLYEKYPDLRIRIGGGGSELASMCELARRTNLEIGAEIIECVGNISDSATFLRSGDLFVGVSRAAIEAGMCDLPIILCGDEGYFGRLREDNFYRALASNFSARGERSADAESLFEDISAALMERESGRVGVLLRKYCSAKACAEATERHYKRLSQRAEQRGGSLLCGYYGYSNMGDDALLLAAIERARMEFPGERVRALTKSGKSDSRKFGIECVARYSPLALVGAIRSSDRVILGGGTLLQNYTSRRSLLYYCALVLLARFLGREVIAWGSGIGKVEGRLSRAICKSAISKCSRFETRDLRSLALARHVIGERAIDGVDLCERAGAICPDEARVSFLLGRIFGEDIPRFLAVALKGNADIELRAEVARMLIADKERGREVVFFVMCEREDKTLSEEMARIVGGRIAENITLADLRGILRRADATYSMRLHALIASRLAGCAAFALGKEEKLSGYMEQRAKD